MASQIVIVAGVNYPRYKRMGEVSKLIGKLEAGVWRRLALTYAKHALDTRRADAITLFDVFNAKVTAFTSMKGHEPVAAEQQIFARVNPKNYRALIVRGAPPDWQILPLRSELRGEAHAIYCPNIGTEEPTTVREYQRRVAPSSVGAGLSEIGVGNVYAHIVSTTFEVAELHFFSHAFGDGPILLNTINHLSAEGKKDLRLDKDGRPDDFSDRNMRARREFARKFSSNSVSVVWGCSAQRAWRARIDLVLDKTKSNKNAQVQFPFKESDWLQPTREQKIEAFQRHFGLSTVASRDGLVSPPITRRAFAAIVEKLAIPPSYNKQLSIATGRPVFGALPGVSSTYDHIEGNRSLQLMHIPQGRRDDENRSEHSGEEDGEPRLLSTEKILRFYETDLKLSFGLSHALGLADVEREFLRGIGRGYAKFTPDGP